MMQPFEQALEAACAEEEIPGAVLLAADRSGKLSYARAFGKRSVREGADQSPLQLSSVMWIASCTKMVTAVAAMQCVERGLLTLDGPVYDVLPEFRDKPVLRKVNEGEEPILQPHRTPITLRHLLNHSSGLAYDETHPKLLAWHAHHGTRPGRQGRIADRFAYPLVFEPGSSWCYGAGIDWAGVMVERATGLDLQAYMERYIFGPAGATDICFSSRMGMGGDTSSGDGKDGKDGKDGRKSGKNENKGRASMRARIVDMSKRDPEAPRRVKRSNARLQWNTEGDCFGGLGLFATPPDYLKVVRALLTTDTDGRLLRRRASVDEFFRPCLPPAAKRALNALHEIQEVRDGMGNIPQQIPKDWGLGGIVNEGDIAGGRSAGTMTWTGLPNLAWFCDRRRGVCALYASQVLPPADARSAELAGLFERGVYEMREAASNGASSSKL